MNVKLEKRGKVYGIRIYQGNQSFLLSYEGTKTNCKWFVKMVGFAIKHYEIEILQKPNDLLRTAYQVASRNGERTNWKGFKKQLLKELKREHKIMYPPSHRELRKKKK